MVNFYYAVGMLIEFINLLLLLRVFMSFLDINSKNVITRIIYEMTEPILDIARKIIKNIGIDTGLLDFSPIVALVLLRFFYLILGRILF